MSGRGVCDGILSVATAPLCRHYILVNSDEAELLTAGARVALTSQRCHMGPNPCLPAVSASQNVSRPHPMALTGPKPLTTTGGAFITSRDLASRVRGRNRV